MTQSSRRSSAEARLRLSLLRALARPTAVAEWNSDRTGLLIAPLPAKGFKRPLRATATQVASLASLGLIADANGRPAVTAAGLAWLRRQLAGEDPYLEQHRQTRQRQIRGTHGAMLDVRVNDAESPLAWLARRKDRTGAAMLEPAQFEAGERLRRDYTFAALGPRVTAGWSNSGASSGASRAGATANAMRDDVIAAKDRVHSAITSVGPELGRMLIDVCCLLKGIEAAETGQRLPQRSGKVVLQLALTSLARHYGLLTVHPRNRGQAPALHWGAWDFRPAI